MACRMDVYDRARELGIQTEFVDGQGHRHVTDATALKIILDALPERNPTQLLASPVVIRSDETTPNEFSAAAALPVAGQPSASSPGPPTGARVFTGCNLPPRLR